MNRRETNAEKTGSINQPKTEKNFSYYDPLEMQSYTWIYIEGINTSLVIKQKRTQQTRPETVMTGF